MLDISIFGYALTHFIGFLSISNSISALGILTSKIELASNQFISRRQALKTAFYSIVFFVGFFVVGNTQASTDIYDIIVFGDEVPGLLAVVCAAREYKKRTGKTLRILVMSKANLQDDIGGHLVRGGLAFLDRSYIPHKIRESLDLPTYGYPSAIYQEFLQRSGVIQVALDPKKADKALRGMLNEVGARILEKCTISTVLKQGKKIIGVQLQNTKTYLGQQFIDATVNAELAQFAGAKKMQGFATFGLPESELPVTLVFETQGLRIQKLKNIELAYIKRFNNPSDVTVQKILKFVTGGDVLLLKRLQKDLFNQPLREKIMMVKKDSITIRSFALSVAYHAWRGKTMSLDESGIFFDKGNIAILGKNRFSWNALLFAVTGSEAEILAHSGAKPTPQMLEEILFVEKWFKSFGATAVKHAPELYIRHSGNVLGAVNPLSGSEILMGGVPPQQALGTFGYHFDIRGGIPGLGNKASSRGINK